MKIKKKKSVKELAKESLKEIEKKKSEKHKTEVSEEKEKKKLILSRILNKKTKIKEIPVLFLRRSGKAEQMFVQPKEGMFKIDGHVYHEKQGSDWEFVGGTKKQKGKIIPEWGLYPLGTDSYHKELKADAQEFQGDVIRAIQTAETIRGQEERSTGKINPKVAVLVIIGIIIVAYFVLGG